MNNPTLLQRLLGANSKVRLFVLLLAGSYAVLRFPQILDGFSPDLKQAIFFVANESWHIAIAAALWFVKQNNVSGNGTLDNPTQVKQSDGTSKVISPLIVALILPAMALTGCGTPAGVATANFLESPANQAIVNIGVQAGVSALLASTGDDISPEMRAPLQSAAVAAGSSLSTGLIYAAAEALRTKQATPQDVSVPALASAQTTQAAIPAPVAQPIAQAVAQLNNQGVPADVANEAVAKTLDAVAAARTPSASQP